MSTEINNYNAEQIGEEQQICVLLAGLLDDLLPEAEHKIWHRHPVWFINGNPIVGYSKLKAGIRLMFWSGASFNEGELEMGTGKFKDASKMYTSISEIKEEDIQRWVEKAKTIQWDYKNIVKKRGKLERLL